MYVDIVGYGHVTVDNRAVKIGDTCTDACRLWYPAVTAAKFPVAMWVSENKIQKKNARMANI